MSVDKLRQQILFEAARLMFQRQEQEYEAEPKGDKNEEPFNKGRFLGAAF